MSAKRPARKKLPARKNKKKSTAAPARLVAAGTLPATRRWLLKTDPESFSFDALWAAPGRRVWWDGVRNHQAKLYLRDAMKLDDLALVYHSGGEKGDAPAVLGLAKIAGTAEPDPTQFDPDDEHFDPKARREAPIWVQVGVEALARLRKPLTIARLRAEPSLRDLPLLARGQRLSVQPVARADFATVLRLGGLDPKRYGA